MGRHRRHLAMAAPRSATRSIIGSGARRFVGRRRASSARGTGWFGSVRARSRARSGEGIKIQARVAESVPDVGADFLMAARVVKAGSKAGDAAAVVPLRPVPGRPRLFEGIAPALADGAYAIGLDAPSLASAPGASTAGPIGEAPLTVAPRETSERVELAAIRDPLDRLASATSGKVFTVEDAAGLPEAAQIEGEDDRQDRGNAPLGSSGRTVAVLCDRGRRVGCAEAAGAALRAISSVRRLRILHVSHLRRGIRSLLSGLTACP